MKKYNREIKELLNKYEIEDLDEFEPEFYIDNLVGGRKIKSQAIKNLYDRGYTNEELIKIKNYKDCGIVEYVADNRFYIENDYIIIEED